MEVSCPSLAWEEACPECLARARDYRPKAPSVLSSADNSQNYPRHPCSTKELTYKRCCCRRAEAVSGLPFDSHQLLHKGEVLSGRSLAEYGVHKGSVLELVPYEPFVPQPMPEGSPLLSSPDHELVRAAPPHVHWLRLKPCSPLLCNG